jgi:hypothetical protein
MMKTLGLLLTIIGSLLVGLSFLWPVLFPPASRWTTEQAEEHSKAGALLHKLALGGHTEPKGNAHGKPMPRASKDELDAARQRWEESKKALDSAKSAGHNTAAWLRWSGAALAAIGMATLAFSKDPVKPRNSSGDS